MDCESIDKTVYLLSSIKVLPFFLILKAPSQWRRDGASYVILTFFPVIAGSVLLCNH